MSLLAFNKTTSPLVLAAGSPVLTLAPSTAAGTRGPVVTVTAALAGLTDPDYAALQVQVAAGDVEYEWTGVPAYAAPGLTVVGGVSATYAAAGSFQLVAPDLTLDAVAGTSDPGDSAFLAPMMGNLFGADLAKTHNYLGGGIFHYSATGTRATTYPAAAVLAGVGDGVGAGGVGMPDGAVVAYVDGDSASTKAGAAFKVMSNNSTPTSGFDFGLDLQAAAHDGYLPVDAAFYKKAQIRMTEDVCMFTASGVPVDGVAGTGAGFAGTGSLYVNSATGEAYLNTGTSASPTWKAITHA